MTMLDISYIRKNPDEVKAMIKRRRSDVDINHLLEVDQRYRESNTHIESLRAKRNALKGVENSESGRQIRQEISTAEETLRSLTIERDEILSLMPNRLAADTPDGEGDKDNVELFRRGEIPTFDFTPKTHEAIGINLGILDIARGTKVAAAGFYYWKGDGAKLVNAIFNLALEFLEGKGFIPMLAPVLAKKRTLYGTGYLPFFSDDIYQLKDSDLCLIGTSEQTLVGYHADEILPEKELPLCYTALTPCFRTEAGSYGKESRGIFRVHQFHKVEQIVFCRPEESERQHEQCLKNEQEFMEMLGIPYRVVRICVGDLGAPAYKKYDVEAWFAGFSDYRETHSNANLLDYQTRRLNIRIKDDKLTVFPHTISATMITDRAALAILENNQQKDGSVKLPKVLQSFLGGKEVIKK
jgi:seryl-tRNA synthetase